MSASIEWQWLPFDALSREQLYALLRLRSEVFVVEQNCVFLDIDGQDDKAMHLLGFRAAAGSAPCPPPALRAPPLPAQNTLAPTRPGAQHDATHRKAIHIAAGFESCHANTPWSARRWDFVTRGLQAQTEHLWWGNAEEIAYALQHAKSVHWQPNPHVDSALTRLQNLLHELNPQQTVGPHPSPDLFEPVERHCRSFSDWWKRTRIAQSPQDLSHFAEPAKIGAVD